MKSAFALLLAACCLSQLAFAREPIIMAHVRRMHQAASATAAGQQSASASAMASNIGGVEQAATGALATGPGATTSGISIAAGQIDTCLSGPNQNLSVCRTLAPSVRAVSCTDIAPDDRFNCTQQAVQYGKCGQDFMFIGSYCLKSCGRCGADCTDNDKPSDGSACDASKCDSADYKSKPTCLKTCQRCSAVA